MEWDDLSETPPAPNNPAPSWDDLSETAPQTQAAAPSWDDLSDTPPASDNQRTWGQEIGRDVRTAARGLIPAAAAGVGIVAGGAGGAAVGGVPGAIVGGLAGGAAAGFAADTVQNKLLDAMGVDSEASRQADAANPNVGSVASEFAPMAASFNVGGLGVKLADRLVNAGAMGMIDIGQQALAKGPSNIDPTEALTAAGAGAVLGAPRAGIQAAGEAVAGRVGAALGRGAPATEATPPVTPGQAAGTATEHAPAPEAQTPPTGVQTGDGFTAVPDTNEYGKNNVATQGEVPGAESTPMVEGAGGPLDDPALGAAFGVGDQSGIMRGESPEPSQSPETPPVQPPAANPDETIGVGDQRGYAGGTPDDMPPAQAERRNPYTQLLNAQQAERRVPLQPKAGRGQLDEPLTPEELASPAGEPNRPAAAQAAIDARPSAQGQRTFPTELISLPKATQAAIKGQPPEVYPDKTGVGSFTPPRPEGSEIPPTRAAQREQLINDIFPGKEPPPDTTGLESTPETPKVSESDTLGNQTIPPDTTGLETPPKNLSLPDDGSIPDFLKRQPQSLSGAATENPSFAAAEVAKQKSKIGSTLSDFAAKIPGVKAFRTAFVPESLTESSGKFGDIVREGQGTVNQSRALYDRAMKPLDEASNSTSPEARDQFSRTFQTGVPADNPLSRLSSHALDTENDYIARLAKVDPEGNWQTGFLPALFEDREGAKNFVTDWQEDERHGVPTIGDFKDAGFQLRKNLLRQDGSDDPVKLMQGLYGARDKFLEGKFIANKATDEGIIFPHNVPGTKLLDGVTRGGAPLYAEPEVATMWNRYFGPNASDPTEKSFFNTAMKIKNGTTAWQLVGGGYHMVAESTEAMNGDVMAAVSQAAAGRFGEAGKKLAGAPLAPYRQATKSATKALEAYYTPEKALPQTRAAMDHLVSAGLTPEMIARYTPDINSATHGFFTGWNVEMPQGLKGVKFDKLGASELKAQFSNAPVSAVFKTLGKTMQTVMDPMFKTYIPRLKVGAALEQMSDYMAANPDKPELYKQKAKEILKSTDDRLGEMNQSTLFWNNNLKKTANMLMISPGWETGTARAALGGAGSFLKNPKSLSITSPDFHPNAAFPFAFAITTATVGSIYQFLKTGEMPKDVRDPFFPRTGGTAARTNEPERAVMPGYLKDIHGWWHGLMGHEGMAANASQQLYNKLAMVPRATWDTMANKDWAGQQIYNPNDPLHEKMREYLNYVQRNMSPIIEQQVAGGQKGTGISKGEAAFGIRHAPADIQTPVKTEQEVDARNKKGAETAAKFRQRMNQ